MMNVKTSTVTTTATIKLNVDKNDIQNMLGELYADYAIKSITFTVPTGGDWSGMTIPLHEMEFTIILEKIETS